MLAIYHRELPVTNFDEIAFHFIECIHFHVQHSRMQKGDTLVQPETRNPSLDAPTPNGFNGSQTSLSNQFSGQFSVDGLKGLDQMVLAYLQQPSNFGLEKGVHRDELAQKLKIHVEKIMESIRVLEEEGLIYSTIDEFHYKSTVGG
ncbi:unnamed protein product [Ilex paraguariensis]|uniref:Replication protein A C-terminal domain-containing protein n=1 Tax=Ilex paraguariensis TaxID=185542 RepID=A0ABC8S3I7_9AQUA